MTAAARIDFCGEIYEATPDRPVTIGREADIAIDDNPYLHRRFLRLEHDGSMWRLANIGSRLRATVADSGGLVEAWLGAGATLPVVFPSTRVWFTAGATTYELSIELDEALFVPVEAEQVPDGATTMGRTTFTPDQQLLLLALAEPVLRFGDRGSGQIPSNTAAAERLGWTLTKFNRKLDNVCQKLSRHGVRGLHGSAERLATSRRARLVEYALAARLVTHEHLVLLDGLKPRAPEEVAVS